MNDPVNREPDEHLAAEGRFLALCLALIFLLGLLGLLAPDDEGGPTPAPVPAPGAAWRPPND